MELLPTIPMVLQVIEGPVDGVNNFTILWKEFEEVFTAERFSSPLSLNIAL